VLFLLEYGVALAPNAALHNQIQPNDTAKVSTDNEMIYRTGALLSLLEMLSLDVYRHDVLAYEKCWVVGIHRNDIKTMWDRDSQLAWPLSRSIAATITQRRQIRFLM